MAKASVIIERESKKAELALGEALPALEAAAAALENLNKDDISELKAFANPSESVINVCMCVQHLKTLPAILKSVCPQAAVRECLAKGDKRNTSYEKLFVTR